MRFGVTNVGLCCKNSSSRRTRKAAHLCQHRKWFALGTSSTNQCSVPAGQRLIIEYVSGYIFAPVSSSQTKVVTMAVTDQVLGLNGAGFHVFPATKVNTTSTTDVFAFSAPLKMMLHPNATFYFSGVAGISVSGYLVKFAGP
jgi:hypothetical protein